MKCSLLLSFLFCALNLSAQTTKALFSTDGYENIMFALGEKPVGADDINVSLYFEKDTLLCGRDMLVYETGWNTEIVLNIIEGKVLVVDSCGSERLIMDFGVMVGDSLWYDGFHSEVLAVGDTTLNDGKIRKTYDLSVPEGIWPEEHRFIEGIGSVYYAIDYFLNDAPTSTYSSCVSDKEGFNYLNEAVNPIICEDFRRNLSDVDEITIPELNIFPNPSSGYLTIENNGAGPKAVIIYDVYGQPLMDTIIGRGINHYEWTTLTPGHYYLVTHDKDGYRTVSRIVLTH